MAEDLLEEIEREDAGDGPASGDGGGKKSKIKGLFGKLMPGKKKLIIIILAALLVLGGIGAGVFFFFSGGKEEPAPEQAGEDTVTEKSIQAALEEQGKAIFEDIVVLEPFEQIALRKGSHLPLYQSRGQPGDDGSRIQAAGVYPGAKNQKDYRK